MTVGSNDMDGIADRVGPVEGTSEGTSDGMVDRVGPVEGMADRVGSFDGTSDGCDDNVGSSGRGRKKEKFFC